MNTFAERLKNCRISLGLSQADLGKKVGLTQGQIGFYENGKTLGVKHILKLANALEVRPEWIMYGTGSKESKNDNPGLQEFNEICESLSIESLEQLAQVARILRKAEGK